MPEPDPRPLARTSPPFDPRPVLLVGRLVRLEPLSLDHVPGLAEVGLDPETWRWMLVQPRDPDDIRRYVEGALEAARDGLEIPFCQVDARTGRPAGMTRMHAIERAHRRFEVGHTWLAPAWRGTGVNAEAKLLLLAYGFDALGAHRVEFKTDAHNARSRAALRAIGAIEEGTLRRHVVTASGRVRDSVYFSVTWDEWPAVRERLAARVEAAVRNGAHGGGGEG